MTVKDPRIRIRIRLLILASALNRRLCEKIACRKNAF